MPTPEEAAAVQIRNIEHNTGRTLADWIAVVHGSGHAKHGAIVKFLKTDHGFTHGNANLIAHKALASDAGSQDGSDLIAAQYAGPKASLKPIYDALLAGMAGLDDVAVAPKKAYVSLRRSKQFAVVQPSTRTRVDLGLNLKGGPVQGRLEPSGSLGGMVSHRVRLASVEDVDGEVIGWLKAAYQRA